MLTTKLYLPQQEQGSLYRGLSRPLAGLYGQIVKLRNWSYDRGLSSQWQLPGFTISIGNITVGGTGKTPVVMALAELLASCGAQPAVLSRGYGSNLGPRGRALLQGGQVRSLVGGGRGLERADEAMLVSQALPQMPVILGSRRGEAAQWYLADLKQEPPSHWLLEDAYQHRQLKRGLNILLIASDDPFGNGSLLPSGSLREPLTAIARADLILVTRCPASGPGQELVVQLRAYSQAPIVGVPFLSSLPRLLLPTGASSQNKPPPPECRAPLLVTGIARPQRLLADLEGHGIVAKRHYLVGDHQAVARKKLLENLAHCDSIVTTSKDYWRDPTVFTNLPLAVYIADTVAQLPRAQIAPYLKVKLT